MTVVPTTYSTPRKPVPPLLGGDRLSAAEFERRYAAMPDLKKAELIDGVVYMPPPVSDEGHGAPHFDVIGWLSMYRLSTPGVVGGDNSTLRLDSMNRPQPDAFLRILPEYGGQAQRDADGYIIHAPELVAEIAASSANYDLNVKLELYRRNDVREYLVWRVYEAAIDWFILRNGKYDTLLPSADGILRSEIFPGLWLDAQALIHGDAPAILKAAQQGLASAEHATFITRLQQP